MITRGSLLVNDLQYSSQTMAARWKCQTAGIHQQVSTLLNLLRLPSLVLGWTTAVDFASPGFVACIMGCLSGENRINQSWISSKNHFSIEPNDLMTIDIPCSYPPTPNFLIHKLSRCMSYSDCLVAILTTINQPSTVATENPPIIHHESTINQPMNQQTNQPPFHQQLTMVRGFSTCPGPSSSPGYVGVVSKSCEARAMARSARPGSVFFKREKLTKKWLLSGIDGWIVVDNGWFVVSWWLIDGWSDG